MMLVLEKFLNLRIFEIQISLELVNSDLLPGDLLSRLKQLILEELNLAECVEAFLVANLPAVLSLLSNIV